MTAIRKILVPTDFSDASQQALRYACGLADALNASLHIVHAVEHPYLAAGYMEVYTPPPEYFEQVERENLKHLQALLTPEESARYRARLVQRAGSAPREILGYLRDEGDIDLVVMATHGRGGVARLMLGSVTDKVVRSAPCPVLTIRATEPPAEAASTAA